MSSAVLLLSGGLDSVVSLALVRQDFDNILALTFNYGQKAFESEKKASEKIARFYNVNHKVIDLDWLKNISSSSLNSTSDVPMLSQDDLDNESITLNSAKSVWVPNRNGLFVNIAACYADAFSLDAIVIGANKEEAHTFKDNSPDFISSVNNALKYSSAKKVKLIAPLLECSKEQIIKIAIEQNIPFEYIFSCYLNVERHCGKCESCMRLKRSLELNKRYDIINTIFN